jgi:hypothetical protein
MKKVPMQLMDLTYCIGNNDYLTQKIPLPRMTSGAAPRSRFNDIQRPLFCPFLFHRKKQNPTTIMTLKVYGMAQSAFTRRVLVTLAEKNISDYELVVVNLPLREQHQPSYVEKAPFGKVPLLDDNGFLIYESRAICQYISRKYGDQGTKLMPKEGDLVAYGLFEQARRYIYWIT